MNLTNFKAGEFEQQLEYKSFKPNMIDHAWVMDDTEVLQLLGQADRALGELNAYAELVPDIDFFIQMYVAKEATQSSRIEGTQTAIEDAFKNAEDVSPEARDDWIEVHNYIEAINFAIKKLETLPLSNRLLKDTHAVLMQGARGKTKMPGQFRTSQNWIGVSLKNAVFVPPHQKHVVELMSDMEKFLQDNEVFVPPLIKIAIAHYQFETIHPFLDGNGRLGRLMISLYLASEKLLEKPALYLSDYFEKNKTAYVDHLMAVRQANQMKQWLVFFLYGVTVTARQSASVFKSILHLKLRIEQDILPRFGSRRQLNAQKLMKYLYSRPVVDVAQIAKTFETTPNTAASLIANLVKYEILVEITGQRRNRLFMFREYVNLFKNEA